MEDEDKTKNEKPKEESKPKPPATKPKPVIKPNAPATTASTTAIQKPKVFPIGHTPPPNTGQYAPPLVKALKAVGRVLADKDGQGWEGSSDPGNGGAGGEAPLPIKIIANANPIVAGVNIVKIATSKDATNIYNEKASNGEIISNVINLATFGTTSVLGKAAEAFEIPTMVQDATTTTSDFIINKIEEGKKEH
jgi:hypothetical protein